MYYLHHYFDPDFFYQGRAPQAGADGSVDCRYLGYVRNVVAGQVLAELVDLDRHPDFPRDARFILAERRLPCGPNCVPHPDNPDKLVAAASGFCFYQDGCICVKKHLNVRSNLGFHTGNIFFIGDMTVHGDIQTGFAVQAGNILVKGRIESAKVKAHGDLVCLGGVKGANTSDVDALDAVGPETGPFFEGAAETGARLPTALVDADGCVRLPFCEHIQLRARGDVIIDGACLHSTLYVGGNLIIRGRLQGGTVYANQRVYIEGQLGSDYNATTRIMMGYDPFNFLKLQKLETQIRALKDKLAYFEKQAARNHVMEQEFTPRADLVRRKLQIAHGRRESLWRQFRVDEKNAGQCRVLVPGKVMPGCEIGIARAWHQTDAIGGNTAYYLQDEEIATRSPALSARDRSRLERP